MQTRVQFLETDGPTWAMALQSLRLLWKKPGGDWIDNGGKPFAMATVSGANPMVWDVTAALPKLLELRTGFIIHRLNAAVPPRFQPRSSALGPTLVVDGVDVPCLAFCGADPSSNKAEVLPTATQSVWFLRFDLDKIPANATKALLTLRIYNQYGACPLACDVLDMPVLLTDPIAQMPDKVKPGLAAQFDRDADLQTHPANVNYVEFSSPKELYSKFNQPSTNYDSVMVDGKLLPMGCYEPEFITNELGLPALRCVSKSQQNKPPGLNGTAITNLYAWTTPTPRKLPYEQPFGQGLEEVWCRYLFKIEPDAIGAFIELALKLPCVSGDFYNETSDPTMVGGQFSARGHWGRPSTANPGAGWLGIYWYGADKLDGVMGKNYPVELGWRENASDRGGEMHAVGCGVVGEWASLEFHLKLNTFDAAGTPLSDGVAEIELNGMLVYRETGIKMRADPRVRMHTVPWMETMHGGTTAPPTPFHVQFSAMCVATQRIGPPKVMLAKLGQQPETPPEDPPTGDDMATLDTAIAKTLDALNELFAVKGAPSVAQQLQDAQANIDAAVAAKTAAENALTAANAKISAAKAAAQADKDNDAARVAGQGVLDALA